MYCVDMNATVSLAVIVSTSIETSGRLYAFEDVCSNIDCFAITNELIPSIGYHQIVVRHTCNSSVQLSRSKYVEGNLRYLLGYSKLQAVVDTEWVLMVDDDVYIHLDSARFLSGFDSKRPLMFADFADMGSSAFSCGGGGFLMSTTAFRRFEFARCSHEHVCEHSPPIVYVDHSLHRCLLSYEWLELKKEFVCGTCGNRWDESFTKAALVSGQCQFMHNQRSHHPVRYRIQVSKHRPLVFHRHEEFRFNAH